MSSNNQIMQQGFVLATGCSDRYVNVILNLFFNQLIAEQTTWVFSARQLYSTYG